MTDLFPPDINLAPSDRGAVGHLVSSASQFEQVRRRRRLAMSGAIGFVAVLACSLSVVSVLGRQAPAQRHAAGLRPTSLVAPNSDGLNCPTTGHWVTNGPSGPVVNIRVPIPPYTLADVAPSGATANLSHDGDRLWMCVGFANSTNPYEVGDEVSAPTDRRPLVVSKGGFADYYQPGVLAGRVSSAVATVMVYPQYGPPRAATLADGYFVSAWPPDTGTATIKALGANGVVLAVDTWRISVPPTASPR